MDIRQFEDGTGIFFEDLIEDHVKRISEAEKSKLLEALRKDHQERVDSMTKKKVAPRPRYGGLVGHYSGGKR